MGGASSRTLPENESKEGERQHGDIKYSGAASSASKTSEGEDTPNNPPPLPPRNTPASSVQRGSVGGKTEEKNDKAGELAKLEKLLCDVFDEIDVGTIASMTTSVRDVLQVCASIVEGSKDKEDLPRVYLEVLDFIQHLVKTVCKAYRDAGTGDSGSYQLEWVNSIDLQDIHSELEELDTQLQEVQHSKNHTHFENRFESFFLLLEEQKDIRACVQEIKSRLRSVGVQIVHKGLHRANSMVVAENARSDGIHLEDMFQRSKDSVEKMKVCLVAMQEYFDIRVDILLTKSKLKRELRPDIISDLKEWYSTSSLNKERGTNTMARNDDEFTVRFKARVQRLTKTFCGRTWLVSDIKRLIDQAQAMSTTFVILCGPAGSGKSAFVSRILQSRVLGRIDAERAQNSNEEELRQKLLTHTQSLGDYIWECKDKFQSIRPNLEDKAACKQAIAQASEYAIERLKIQSASFDDLGKGVLAYHFCDVRYPDSLVPKMWLGNLIAQLYAVVDNEKFKDKLLHDNKYENIAGLKESAWFRKDGSSQSVMNECLFPALSVLDERAMGHRTIWIDALDEALTYHRPTESKGAESIVMLLEQSRDKWPSWITIVTTSRPDPLVKDELRILGYSSIDVLREENNRDIRGFVDLRLRKFATLSGSGQPSNEKQEQLLPSEVTGRTRSILLAKILEDLPLSDKELYLGCLVSKEWLLSTLTALICRKAKGVFMYAAEVLNQMEEKSAIDNSLTLLTGSSWIFGLPNGIARLYMERYTNMFSDDMEQYEKYSRPMLGALVAARAPITRDMLHMIVFGNENSRDNATSASFLLHLRFVVHMCAGNASDGYVLSHKSFSDWLTEEFNDDSPTSTNKFFTPESFGHNKLAVACLCYMKSRKDLDQVFGTDLSKSHQSHNMALKHRSSPFFYALKYGVTHMLEYADTCDGNEKIEWRQETRKLILSVSWLMAKAIVDFMTEGCSLVDDYNKFVWTAIKDGSSQSIDRVVDLLRKAVGLSLHDLHINPQRLPGQLIGRLLGAKESPGKSSESESKGDVSANGVTAASELARLLTKLKNYENYGFDWWCPISRTMEQASGGCLRTMKGHTCPVTSVAISKDGTHIVSGSRDKTLRVWDRTSGEAIMMIGTPLHEDIERYKHKQSGVQLNGHKKAVLSLAISPDGKSIASASANMTVCVWDIETGIAKFKPLKVHGARVLCVAFSPNGKFCVSGSVNRTALVWDSTTGAIIGGPFEEHSSSVLSIAISPDSSRVASGGGFPDNGVHVWCVENPSASSQHIHLEGHEEGVKSVAFSPDGKWLASGGGKDKTVRVWQLQSGGCIVLSGHTNAVTSVAYSPDGKCIASGSVDMSVRLWDSLTGSCSSILEGHSGVIQSIAFTPDGMSLVSASDDRTMRVWDTVTGMSIAGSHERHDAVVKTITISPDGKLIVSGSADTTLRIWDADTGLCTVGPLRGHVNDVNVAEFSPDSKKILSGSQDKTLRVWDTLTGACTLLIGIPWSNARRLSNYDRQGIPGSVEGHKGWVKSAVFSPDGKLILSGSADETACLWQANSGKLRKPLQGHKGSVTSVAFSPDGSKAITTGSKDRQIFVWLVPNGNRHKVLSGHDRPILSISFSADGLRVLSKSAVQSRIWVLASEECETDSSPDFSIPLYPNFKSELPLTPCESVCEPVSLGLHLKKVILHRNGKVACQKDGDRVHIFHVMRSGKTASSTRPAEMVK